MGISLLNRISGSSFFHSNLQQEVDGLVGGFVQQATDWRALAAMTAGGLAYRTGRLGAMELGDGSLLRAASVGLGLTAEVSTFEFSHRALESLNPPNPPLTKGGEGGFSNLWRWNGPGGLAQGLLQSFMTFGTLKGAGRLAQGENLIAQHLFQDSAMVLGHQVTGILGLAPQPNGNLAEQFLHAEATNLEMGAGMALGLRLTPGMAALERGMDLSGLYPSRGSGLPVSGTSQFKGSWAFAMAISGGEGKDTREPSKESVSILMVQKGEGGESGPSSEPDLNVLKRKAKKKSPEAYETLEDLAREGNYGAVCVLAELAKRRVAAVFALMRAAEGGSMDAWTKLKILNPQGLVAGLGWRDPTRGSKADAFLYLAGIGNRYALEILVQDASLYMERGSLNLLFSLAELGHIDAIRGIAEAARRNPKAVEALARLAEKDIRSARYYLEDLDAGHYESVLRMEHFEMAEPLATLARFQNAAAFAALAELAPRYEAAVKALAILARSRREDALLELGKVLKSQNEGPAREAAIALNALADAGSKMARELLPPPTLVRMVEVPPRTFLGRIWRIYSSYVDKLWTWR